jgi:glycine betaine/proline transport system ATP-binding protein
MHCPARHNREAGVGSNGSPRSILSCERIWKIFGSGGKAALAAYGGSPSFEQLAAKSLFAALRDVTLDIRIGEIFVIMGLSGSGKSTLVRCMSRLIEPTAGRVIFEGDDLLQASERQMVEIRRHKMGMVFQHFALLPHRQVIENVAFPLEVQGVERRARLARAQELLDLVGLRGKESHYPHELSGGQQQRVGIARSLAVEPEIWFLDEPFSALDPLIRSEMQVEFLRLQGLLRKSIVFITHDFDEAIRLADRIAIMKSGEVVQIGTPEELVLTPGTEYVAEFTRDVSRAKVLSVASVMGPPVSGLSRPSVRAADKIEKIASHVFEADGPVPVEDDSGRIVGAIASDTVGQVLLNRLPR